MPQQVNLWVGSRGTIARMHYDCSPNYFYQVRPACRIWYRFFAKYRFD
jgi:hypothetical protein